MKRIKIKDVGLKLIIDCNYDIDFLVDLWWNIRSSINTNIEWKIEECIKNEKNKD